MTSHSDLSSRDLEQRFIEAGGRRGWWRHGRAFRYYCRRILFDGIQLQGRRLLDIGCGNGRFCMWAAVQGAAEVLGLEPSAEGSRGSGPVRQFREMIDELGLSNVRVSEETFQELDPTSNAWDTVLLHASINHLDEPACIRLLEDESAREVYRGLFRKVRSLMPAGGRLIITDCARRNLFADLGLRNPFVPTIEWHKHHQPETWASLLEPCGFARPRVIWVAGTVFGPLGAIGRNRLWAYLTRSYFRMTLEAC